MVICSRAGTCPLHESNCLSRPGDGVPLPTTEFSSLHMVEAAEFVVGPLETPMPYWYTQPCTTCGSSYCQDGLPVYNRQDILMTEFGPLEPVPASAVEQPSVNNTTPERSGTRGGLLPSARTPVPAQQRNQQQVCHDAAPARLSQPVTGSYHPEASRSMLVHQKQEFCYTLPYAPVAGNNMVRPVQHHALNGASCYPLLGPQLIPPLTQLQTSTTPGLQQQQRLITTIHSEQHMAVLHHHYKQQQSQSIPAMLGQQQQQQQQRAAMLGQVQMQLQQQQRAAMLGQVQMQLQQQQRASMLGQVQQQQLLLQQQQQRAAFLGQVQQQQQRAAFLGQVQQQQQRAAFLGQVQQQQRRAAFLGQVQQQQQRAAFLGQVQQQQQQHRATMMSQQQCQMAAMLCPQQQMTVMLGQQQHHPEESEAAKTTESAPTTNGGSISPAAARAQRGSNMRTPASKSLILSK
ncbi:putative mediator of RNA polymerase II transcription subunit 26 [Schistocerca piceifrons]|uniref:putative mediator of RNA polymerase II transcription subunit 26 n=1 Tax=Schistocerca piceifrons TaxID=274613 RepID=UPI001F5F543A|nr:putative mediator of RNA polymerase II transcription subunit 26 [Schistocerca piceifrons]